MDRPSARDGGGIDGGMQCAEQASRSRRFEAPTMLLALAIYAGWLALTWWHAALPIWALIAAVGWIVAWHGSLQHETIHDHPSSRQWLNALIGGVPLALWIPYAVYRRSHIAHHLTPWVTDPLDDPESRYLSGREGRLSHYAMRLEASLVGRMLLGPVFTIVGLLAEEGERSIRQPGAVLRDWLPHLVGVAIVLTWLHVCDLSIGRYILCFVYPGMALTLLRSFAEHRAAPLPGHRVAIVEDAGPLGLLFLNNNLHAAHHRAPGIAWYDLPAYYARNRAALLTENGGLLYRGYGDVFARFFLRPHDGLLHPDHR